MSTAAWCCIRSSATTGREGKATASPGFRSRVAHHIDFPDYAPGELMAIAEMMLTGQNYRLDEQARTAFAIGREAVLAGRVLTGHRAEGFE